MVFFGQVILGPPGAGKTTYCRGMQMYLTSLGRRCAIVNLDFANDSVPYECSVDVRDLISLERVMDEFDLGPNGGLIYCMEYLLEHAEWLKDRLEALEERYVLFDFPGQVELYTHHTSVQDLLALLTDRRGLDARLCSVHLVDSHYCVEPATFISAVLLVAASMLRLELPHVSVLSKIDLLRNYDNMPFQLNFFTELIDLTPLSRYVGRPFKKLGVHEGIMQDGDEDEVVVPLTPLERKYSKMSEGICEVLTDLGLVSFLPMNIEDGETVGRVLSVIDKANGYSFAAHEAKAIVDSAEGKERAAEESVVDRLFRMACGGVETEFERSLEIMERYEPGSDLGIHEASDA